ncbi:LpqB family beta-propeller domain-containing protein [Georgenia sp. Z1344]|uniref:LpqB family beta-propeller domain-containing protein n=1 Tax=Georgenia sp. Z1344 TaxID=3416706 RepID=UPI003CEC383D
MTARRLPSRAGSPPGAVPASAFRRAAAKVLAPLLALALLAGCAQLPGSGPVVAADPTVSAAPSLGLYARGPQEGATPEEVVQGFLAASATGFADDFSVAREFLGGQATTGWQPLAQARVYADHVEPSIATTDDGGVSVSTELLAVVDGSGHYTESASDHEIVTDFTLARDDDGEWRIIDLEDGVLLSAESFSVQYTAAPLYFPAADGETVVADLRHYPRQHLAASLVQGVLSGPSAWLEPAVLTPAPLSTRLVLSSVDVADGVATVDLTDDVLEASSRERELLVAQLRRTLAAVPGVSDVTVTVGGNALAIGSVPQLPAYPYRPQPLLAVSDGELVELDGGLAVRVTGAAAPRTGEASAPAGSPADPPDGQVYLDGPTRMMAAPTAGRSARLVVSGSNLVAPSMDRYGWAWTGETTNTGSLRTAVPSGGTAEVDAPWLDGSVVRALRVSREGSRVAVIREQGGSVLVEVAGVQRATDDTPRSLGTAQARVGVGLVDATDLAWIDSTTLVVLGRTATDPGPRPYLVRIGGDTEPLPVLQGAVSLTGGRGETSIVVQTSDDGIYERTGASWTRVADDLADPAYPG